MRLILSTLSIALVGLTTCGDHPPGIPKERPRPSTLVGARCSDDSDCQSKCERGGSFPGGFCTLECLLLAECPSGTVCVYEDSGDMKGVCLYPCRLAADCASVSQPYDCGARFSPTSELYRVCIDD